MRARRAFSHSTTSTAMCTRRTRRWDRRAIRRRTRSPSSVPLPRCPRPSRTRSGTAPSMSRFRPKGSSSLQFSQNGEARTMTKGWAIVTGASGGMGAEFTRALTERGHPVLAVGRGAERLSRLAARVRASGEVIETLAADLATPEGVETVVARAHALGDVELLVNNAGLSTSGPFLDQSADREIESIRVNVEALYRLTRAILPGMVARNRGGVIRVVGFVNRLLAVSGALTPRFVLRWLMAQMFAPTAARPG